jgi:1-Cys peroxiredoxin 6
MKVIGNSLTGKFPFPIIADHKRELAVKLGMLHPEEVNAQGMVLTCRAVSMIVKLQGMIFNN